VRAPEDVVADLLPMTGVVLAGGRSTRMGRDKALLALDDGGEALVTQQVRRLGAIFARVILSAGDAARYAGVGVPVAVDRFPGAGPLAGIAAALEAAETDWAFCCAVDMPFVSEPLVRHMAGLALAGGHDIVVPRGEKGAEPLHAAYARSCRARFEERLRAGRNKVDAAFEGLRVRFVEPDEVARFDAGRRSFVNVNTPEDLEAARREAAA